MVIEQKTLKFDIEIEKITNIEHETKRQLKQLNIKLDLVNGRLYAKRKHHENIENECEYFHTTIKNKLHAAEMELIQLEQNINNDEQKIENHKDIALQKHHEALAWETKWKMINEIQKYRQQEMSTNSEIGIMKGEIHRMEIRYGQLKRAQEKLVQDMENCIMHRDHIFDDASIREKLNGTNKSHKIYTKSSMEHRFIEIKNKLKQITIEYTMTHTNLIDVNDRKEKLTEILIKLKKNWNEQQIQNTLLENEIEQAILLKQEV